jgi:hypothetical protein
MSTAAGRECVICMEADKDCLFLPCSHMSTCMSCAQSMLQHGQRTCIVCRAEITRLQRVYT